MFRRVKFWTGQCEWQCQDENWKNTGISMEWHSLHCAWETYISTTVLLRTHFFSKFPNFYFMKIFLISRKQLANNRKQGRNSTSWRPAEESKFFRELSRELFLKLIVPENVRGGTTLSSKRLFKNCKHH